MCGKRCYDAAVWWSDEIRGACVQAVECSRTKSMYVGSWRGRRGRGRDGYCLAIIMDGAVEVISDDRVKQMRKGRGGRKDWWGNI